MNFITKLFPVIFICAVLAGCPLDGDDGDINTTDLGSALSDLPGANCWDTNSNGAQDVAEEDKNYDGVVDVNDCHVDADIVRQNPDAEYNHENICKAFHALGLDTADPAALAALGCHSQPTATVVGTVQDMTSSIVIAQKFIINDKSDGSPDDNILFVDPEPADVSSGFQVFYLKMNAYIAQNPTFDYLAAGGWGQCKTICEGDNECIAAYAEPVNPVSLRSDAVNSTAGVCHVFHRSDALIKEWSQVCGYTQSGEPVEEACAGFSTQMHLWIRATTIY